MFQDSLYSQYIFVSRYARYLDKDKRRETWKETVGRYFDFFQEYLSEEHNFDLGEFRVTLEAAVLRHDVMPSMRAIMTAGKALSKDHGAGYNCSYLPIDSLKSFDEEMYTLMLGTGVGFSVEQEHVKQIPPMPDEFYPSETTVVFDDSRIGWAKGYREFISLLASGHIPKYDVSKLRLAGARLKTFGGRASGPGPLVDLLEFTKGIFLRAAGRNLTTIECHDLACKVADVVVSGGVRRSALISLSDLEDGRMRDCKSGNWWQTHEHRRLSNNSAIYEEKPEVGVFMKEWLSLYESKSGERGIISRKAMKKVIEDANKFRAACGPDFRQRETNHKFGKNPCSEIILRPNEFCNVSSVQIYEDDTLATLLEKVKVATILGTLQACLTNFRYINKKWQRNCEDERLLGVSLNGIYDNLLMYDGIKLPDILQKLKRIAIETNAEWAKKLGINSSVAITCVKPEGTTSALNGTSSGIHPAHSPFYIRYVRNDIKDPLVKFMIAKGFPHEQDAYSPNQMCFKFPVKSGKNAICKDNVSAISHLELWKTYQQHYCEHTPSITVSVKETEWMAVGAWCYENFDWLSGVAFLPADETTTIYKQTPFTTCTEEQYEELLALMPKECDWSGLVEFEIEDSTTNAKDLACVAGGCAI